MSKHFPRMLGAWAFALTALCGVRAEADEPKRIVILKVSAPDVSGDEPSIYDNYLAAVVQNLGYSTVSVADVNARIELADAQRFLGCKGAGCVEVAGQLNLDLQGDEILTAQLDRASKGSPLVVVMARLDAATGVALDRFEGEAATETALRQTLRRGVRTLFGRQVDPSATGALLVQTQPEGVVAELDGKRIGRTPIVLEDVSAGDHELVLTSSTARVVRSVFVQPGEVAPVRIAMARPPVTVHVFTQPAGARVMVGGEPVGQSPVILEDITDDTLDIRIEKPGFRPAKTRVRLADLDSEARRAPKVELIPLKKRWPVGVGTWVGTTFDALTASEGTGFSAEVHANLFTHFQLGVGYAHPTTVFGSFRAFAVRQDLEFGLVTKVVGVQVGGDAVDPDLRRWETAFMSGLILAYSRETAWGRFGLMVEGGPSFLVDGLDGWTVPVTVAGTWRFQ